MPDAERQGLRYRFAGFELEPDERRLLLHGARVTLTPKVFDTLVLLVERAGHVVSRDELMAALWPRGFVTDGNLAKHIWAIRKALGECEGDSQFIETVPKLGYRFTASVECCVGDTPDADPSKTADAGQGATTAAVVVPLPRLPTGQPLLPAWRRRGVVAAVMLAIVVAVMVVGGGLWWSSHRTPHAQTAGKAVAIVAFNNLSRNPKDAWLGPALTDMLATEVTATGKLDVIPGGLVRPARKGLPAPAAGGYAPASLAMLHKRLGADYVISGSYLVSGTGANAKLRVDLVVQDARDGTGIAAFSRSQPASDLLKMVANAGATLRVKLGLPVLANDIARQLTGAQPPTPDVARHIGFALDALHMYDPARARDELLQAVAEAPGYAPARMLLARAWLMLGQHDKALSEVQWAASHLGGLLPRQQALITARKLEVQRNWLAAAGVYRRLVERHPGDIDYRLDQVEDLWKAGRLDEADKALDAVRKLSLPVATVPRIELAAWHIAYSRGDTAGEAASARKALQAARAVGAADLVANSEYFLGQTYGRTGKPDASRKLLSAAYAYFQRSGDLEGQASVQRRLGWLAAQQHDWPAAQLAYQRALAIYQSVGNLFWQSQTYLGLSRVQLAVGDFDVARASAKRAAELARQIGETDQQAFAKAALANLELLSGAVDAPLAKLRQSIQMQKQYWDKTRLPWTLARYADALRASGQLVDAQAACVQARTIAQTVGAGQQKFALLACIRIELARGQASAARRDCEQLLSLASQTHDRYMHGMALLQQARQAIDTAEWPVAESRLKAIVASQLREPALKARARAWLALTANALGDTTSRDRSATRARVLRAKLKTWPDAIDVDLALARLEGAMGQRDAAVSKLRAMASDADRRHRLAMALEVRVAAYRLLEKSRDPAARVLYDRIESTAKAHGFKWVLARLDRPLPVASAIANN